MPVESGRTPRQTEFLEGLGGEEIRVNNLDVDDYQRAAALVDRYADLDLGFVDASVISVAERLRIDTIVTIDRRHFHVVRAEHVAAFTLLS